MTISSPQGSRLGPQLDSNILVRWKLSNLGNQILLPSQAYILPAGASSHWPSLYLSSPLSLRSGSSGTLVHPGTFLSINLVSSTHSPIPWLLALVSPVPSPALNTVLGIDSRLFPQDCIINLEEVGYSTGCTVWFFNRDCWASLGSQMVKNPPAMRENWVQSLG